MGKTTVDGDPHGWLTDSLRPAQENAKYEKADFAVSDATPRKRLYNNLQQFMGGYVVSDKQQAVKKAGIKDEIAYQMVKASKEIARDLEMRVLLGADRVAGNSDSTAGKMGGVRFFVGGDAVPFTAAITDVVTVTGHTFQTGEMATVYPAADATLPAGLTANKPYFIRVIDANTFTLHATDIDAQANTNVVDITSTGTGTFYICQSNIFDATGVTFNEDAFNDAMHNVWKHGGQPDIAVVSGRKKRAMSKWTDGSTKFVDGDLDTLRTKVSVYESDYGQVAITTHLMQTDDRIDFLQLEHMKLAYLIPFHREDVPRKGTYQEKLITGIATMECRSPISQGAMINLA